jgi:hypothetical protein
LKQEINIGFSEGLSDAGELTGRGNPLLREEHSSQEVTVNSQRPLRVPREPRLARACGSRRPRGRPRFTIVRLYVPPSPSSGLGTRPISKCYPSRPSLSRHLLPVTTNFPTSRVLADASRYPHPHVSKRRRNGPDRAVSAPVPVLRSGHLYPSTSSYDILKHLAGDICIDAPVLSPQLICEP